MAQSRVLLLLGISLLVVPARISRAQDCPTVTVGLQSETLAGATQDGPHGGDPAHSSASYQAVAPGLNVGTTGAVTIGFGGFVADAYAAGTMAIRASASNNGLARIRGDVADCLLVGGYAGAGVLHIPVHVTGGVIATWSTTPEYEPTPGAEFAGGVFGLSCLAGIGVQAISCTGDSFVWSDSAAVDDTLEFVLPIPFGTSVSLFTRTSLTASMGYSANGSEGELGATADASLVGALEPAYVVDDLGAPLPNATIAASSGFDYLHPTPEPAASLLEAAALAALVPLRRRRS
jgi:hypothetical protein